MNELKPKPTIPSPQDHGWEKQANDTELLICWNIENSVPPELSAILSECQTSEQESNAVDDDECFVDVTSDDEDE